MKDKELYLNPKAKRAVESKKQTTILLGGRGFSKSTAVGARYDLCARKMPRSWGSLWGLTYTQILTKVLPSATKQLRAMGYVQDRPGQPGHFVIGRQPPPYFKRPHNEVLRWENSLTFFNGSGLEFISADRPDLMAGGSFDYAIFDEAVYFPQELHDAKAVPSIRGNRRYFRNSPYHHSFFYVSSQSWTADGYYVEDLKYLRDDDGNLVTDQEGNPLLDSDAMFLRGTSWDNVKILGKNTIKRWKRTLPKVTYDIEIMSKRIALVDHAYYERFDRPRHTYIRSTEYGYHEKNEFGIYVKKKDTDRDPSLPLIITMDFGTKFNSLLVSQFHPKTGELRVIKEFFESSNQLLQRIITPFCKFYEDHPTKDIFVVGDPAGNKMEHMEVLSLFDKVNNKLRDQGWKVHFDMLGRAYPVPRIRHEFINDILSEETPRMPYVRINYVNCPNLLTSMKNAPMGKDGGKDKGSEKQKNRPQQTATHLSDAFDYLMMYFLYPLIMNSINGSSDSRARIGKRRL